MRQNIVLLLVIVSFLNLNGQSKKELVSQLDLKVPKFMKEKNVPGMAIAVIDKGQVIYKNGYGFSNISKSDKIQTSTGFNIGSISKLYTAIGVMKLVEDGKIDLDFPAEKYLTRWKLPKSQFDKSKVTIRALLNHTAGISVHGYPGFTNRRSLPSIEESLDGNNGPARADEKVEIIIEPQTKFKYSGGGYTILQLIIEEVTAMPFHKYMSKAVFKPLKMRSTGFKITNRLLKKSAIPYDKKMKPLPFEYWTAQGAAGLQTSLDDFILFADDIINNYTLLSEKTIHQMITPTKVSGKVYGLGFHIMKRGAMVFKGHSGSNTGWQSAFFLDFKTKSGLIMMTNGDEGKRTLQNTLRLWASWKYARKHD